MEPTNRSNVGNSTGGQNLPPANNTPQFGYDPIFSPTGRAGVQQASVTPTIISGPATPATPATPPPDPNHTTSTATGDIVLSRSPSAHKSNLPLIIGLVAAIILIIAGLVFLMVNPFNKSGSTSTAASFNKFINYLYDGSDSTATNTSYADTPVFKFEDALSDGLDERVAYFTTARQLFDDFNNNLHNDDITSDQQSLIDNLDQNLSALQQVAAFDPLTTNQLVKYYLAHDFEDTKSYLINYYQQLSNSNNELVRNYGNDLYARDLNTTLRIYIYQINNCLSNNTINTTCVEAITDDFNLQALDSSATTIQARLDARLNNYTVTIIDTANQFNLDLNGIEYELQEEYVNVP